MMERHTEGITLTELVISIAIVGGLSSISYPSLISQLHRSRQAEAQTYINQIITQVSAYNDEFRTGATGWSDLDKIATIPTDGGSASGSTFGSIKLPSGNYTLSGSTSESKYIFSAEPTTTKASNYKVISCINTATGTSQVISGGGKKAAKMGDLKC